MSLIIRKAQTKEDFQHIRDMFIQYQQWLGVDLCFQGFQQELNDLPSKYDCLLVGEIDGQIAACVGLWRVAKKDTCEMKRLYVRDAFKGKGFGRLMALEIIEQARQLGYRHMCLDTLERLQPAIKLYESLGFKEYAPYYDNPRQQVLYLEKTL